MAANESMRVHTRVRMCNVTGAEDGNNVSAVGHIIAIRGQRVCIYDKVKPLLQHL